MSARTRNRALAPLLACVALLAAGGVSAAEPVDQLAAPSVVQVTTTIVDYTRLRAVVFMEEIYPVLAIEAIEPGGEGAPATLTFRHVVSQFSGKTPQGWDAISQLTWKGQVLHFRVDLAPDGAVVCELAAKPKAKPTCTPAK